jgi:DNA-binding CsgD family transcriptional regulator
LDSIGATAFAKRARTELRATGGRARRHAVLAQESLTAQEAVIALLADEGASNAQIAAQLFISRATVAYHLRKVFIKLDIDSRHQIGSALSGHHRLAFRHPIQECGRRDSNPHGVATNRT